MNEDNPSAAQDQRRQDAAHAGSATRCTCSATPEPALELPESILRRIKGLQRAARHHEQLGAHDFAETLYARVCAIHEAEVADICMTTMSALNDLARSRLNAGHHDAAGQTYRKLLAQVIQVHGPGDALVAVTRQQIEHCEQAARERRTTGHLQVELGAVLRRILEADADRDAGRERVRRIARALMARGRTGAAARVMQHWIDTRVRAGLEEGEDTMQGIRAHAIALWQAGHVQQAESALRSLVILRNRCADSARRNERLKAALDDWGACQAALGQAGLARETARLAASIGYPDSGSARP